MIKVYLFDRAGLHIDLDPEAVVGGDYTFWNPTYACDVQIWRAAYRPVEVEQPLNISHEDFKVWDGREGANSRRWHVEHVCGLTAAQIVAGRRRRRSA
ncbi:hypothetical protein E1292_28305 [Nonomuraea deserti]|uniref:Uncharacterized protein n=1 Tax=Nonomuraea deserti TaxID=1848322 RepID=A0A4R4V7A2_9ACTN|nr:hypothetical protein [Nonomuraea deserti]TDD00561.1 hypothetical protein E1292_28305 [Nonomuraea deserti]